MLPDTLRFYWLGLRSETVTCERDVKLYVKEKQHLTNNCTC